MQIDLEKLIREEIGRHIRGEACKSDATAVNPRKTTRLASWRSGDAADCKKLPSTPYLSEILIEYHDDHLVTLKHGDERLAQLQRCIGGFSRIEDISQAGITRILGHWKGGTRNRYRSALTHFFKWCRLREYTDFSPEFQGAREKPRDVVMSLRQLRALYRAAPRRGDWEGFCRLLILTGQRLGEVQMMDEIDGERWTQRDTKNGTDHIVHLTERAAKLAERRAEWYGRTALSDMKRRWFRDAGLFGDYRIHDIRRSFATHLVENGASEVVVDRALNHVAAATSRGVARVYNRAQLLDQRRELMHRWDDLLFGNTE